ITRGGDFALESSAREGAVRADVVGPGSEGWSSADGAGAHSAAARPDVLESSSEGPAGARDAAGADVAGASSGRESAAAGTGAVVRADVVRARSVTDSYDMGAGVRDAAALGGVGEVSAGEVGARVRGAAARGGVGEVGAGVRDAVRGGVRGVESGGGFGVGVSAVGGLVKVVGGGVVGLAVGFLGGVFGAAMASVLLGDGAAVVTPVCVTALFGAVGAWLGAGAARRSAEHAQLVAAYGGEGAPPVYTPPPLFPRPELPETPRWVLPSAAGAGVFAAIALPGAQVGLGIVLVAVVLGAAALPAVGRRVTPWTVAFGLTAYWLVAIAAVRDADWLVGILLVAG